MDRLDRLTRLLSDYVSLGLPKSKPRAPRSLARAVVIRSEPTPPLPSVVAPKANVAVLEPFKFEPQVAPRPTVHLVHGQDEMPAARSSPTGSIPCGYCVEGGAQSNYTKPAVYCGVLSDRYYCPDHYAEVFNNPVNRLLPNVRPPIQPVQRQRH